MGIVVEDKLLDTDFIKVTPIEDLTHYDGMLNAQTKSLNETALDIKSVPKNSSIVIDSTLLAKWVPLSSSNRSTSPNVIKNETVAIYRHSDTDEYFWNTMFHEPNIRRLEKVRYSFGNETAPLVAYGDNSSYWVEYSTIDKHIKIHTSVNDGEAAGYDVVFDTKKGTFSLTDTINNSVILDSVSRVLTVNTKDVIVNAEEKAEVNTQTATVNASSSTNIISPTTNVSNDLNVGGNLVVKGTAGVDVSITTPVVHGKADTAGHADTASSIG